MFCSYCGKETSNKNKYCSSCGAKLDLENIVAQDTITSNNRTINSEVKQPKVISILALIFSILIAPIGFILSIIGIVKCGKYKKKQGYTCKYLPFNITGLILSIIVMIIILIIAFVFGIIYLIFKAQDPKLNGTWDCTSNDGLIYTTQIKFDSGDFEWSKYGDINDNSYTGSYKILSREYKDERNEYNIRFDIEESVLNGVYTPTTQSKFSEVIFDENKATIKSNNNIYYCVKEK